MQSHLIPTPTIDRNGKATTVYRRAGLGATTSGKLAAARPSVAAAGPSAPSGPLDSTIVMAKPDTTWGAADRIQQLFAEIAPGVRLGLPAKGVAMSGADAYSYLAMGVSLEDAALLHHAAPDARGWAQDPTAQAWAQRHLNAVQQGGTNGDRVDEAVAAMRAHGVPPKKVHRMIENGFSNRHLDGALDADQLVHLLTRLRYERSSVLGKTARGAHMMNLVIDGTLPFELVERGYHKNVLTDLAHDLVPVNGKFREHPDPVRCLTQEDAAAVLGDPGLIVTLGAVMEEDKAGAAVAWHAIRTFGEDEALACPTEVIMGRTRNGELVGPAGWRRARDFMQDHLGVGGGRTSSEFRRSGDGYYWYPPKGGHKGQHYSVAEILDVLDASSDPEGAARMLTSGLTSEQLVAVLNGSTALPLVDGWL